MQEVADKIYLQTDMIQNVKNIDLVYKFIQGVNQKNLDIIQQVIGDYKPVKKIQQREYQRGDIQLVGVAE